MDKRYLKVLNCVFQSKDEARKRKEAREAVESSRVERRKKTAKIRLLLVELSLDSTSPVADSER